MTGPPTLSPDIQKGCERLAQAVREVGMTAEELTLAIMEWLESVELLKECAEDVLDGEADKPRLQVSNYCRWHETGLLEVYASPSFTRVSEISSGLNGIRAPTSAW